MNNEILFSKASDIYFIDNDNIEDLIYCFENRISFITLEPLNEARLLELGIEPGPFKAVFEKSFV